MTGAGPILSSPPSGYLTSACAAVPGDFDTPVAVAEQIRQKSTRQKLHHPGERGTFSPG